MPRDQAAYIREWRLRTGRTKSSHGTRTLKIGTRSCYNKCHLRPEGAHSECAQANREYQAEYARLARMGLSMRDESVEAALR